MQSRERPSGSGRSIADGLPGSRQCSAFGIFMLLKTLLPAIPCVTFNVKWFRRPALEGRRERTYELEYLSHCVQIVQVKEGEEPLIYVCR